MRFDVSKTSLVSSWRVGQDRRRTEDMQRGSPEPVPLRTGEARARSRRSGTPAYIVTRVHDRHVTCQEIVELVTEYLDATLDGETAELFEEHINFCEGCEAYLAQMRHTIATVASVEPVQPPAVIRDRLMSAFREWKQA
jgi:Putative zinc-finger